MCKLNLKTPTEKVPTTQGTLLYLKAIVVVPVGLWQGEGEEGAVVCLHISWTSFALG